MLVDAWRAGSDIPFFPSPAPITIIRRTLNAPPPLLLTLRTHINLRRLGGRGAPMAAEASKLLLRALCFAVCLTSI